MRRGAGFARGRGWSFGVVAHARWGGGELRRRSPGGMFRRPPRNFRGRRRAASSGSSEEEPQPSAAPAPPAPGSGSDSEREAEPEEGGGDPGSAAAFPEGARAAAAEGPLSPEEPAGSPGGREASGRAATGRGPRLAGTGPARGGRVLLSFGSEEEREGKGSAASPSPPLRRAGGASPAPGRRPAPSHPTGVEGGRRRVGEEQPGWELG